MPQKLADLVFLCAAVRPVRPSPRGSRTFHGLGRALARPQTRWFGRPSHTSRTTDTALRRRASQSSARRSHPDHSYPRDHPSGHVLEAACVVASPGEGAQWISAVPDRHLRRRTPLRPAGHLSAVGECVRQHEERGDTSSGIEAQPVVPYDAARGAPDPVAQLPLRARRSSLRRRVRAGCAAELHPSRRRRLDTRELGRNSCPQARLLGSRNHGPPCTAWRRGRSRPTLREGCDA
jgi:hypothetical protein